MKKLFVQFDEDNSISISEHSVLSTYDLDKTISMIFQVFDYRFVRGVLFPEESFVRTALKLKHGELVNLSDAVQLFFNQDESKPRVLSNSDIFPPFENMFTGFFV